MSGAEHERLPFNKHNFCTSVTTSSTINHISDLMIKNILGKEVAGWNAASFVKSWFDCI